MEYLALYLRLSMEDKKDIENSFDKNESNSISSQRKQIQEYIQNNTELMQYKTIEFCDDGYSGTNMERPAMQELLKKIKENHIRCIIVKDMSRFSRDYIEMGTYLNQIFPFMGIRFIAINDHYDSREHQGNTIEIDIVFQTLLYDLYSKDVSIKAKASFENKCADGEYVFGQVPFGYEKSREVKNIVVVNEKEAEIVRYIFLLAVQGNSSTQIAKRLYEEQIPTITQMRKPDKIYMDDRIHTWNGTMIRKILNNRFYLGEMAYGKTVRKFVGSKSSISVPKEEWKVIPNHHEALVSEEIFKKVALLESGKSTKRKREKHPLVGKLYCGGCGYSLSYKPCTEKNRYRRFECRKYALLKISECCTCIRADLLEEMILLMLNKELMIWGNAVKEKEELVSFQQTENFKLKKKIEEYQGDIKQTEAERGQIYEKYAFGEFSEEEYQKKVKEIENKKQLLSEKQKELVLKFDRLEEEYRKTEADMKQMIRYSHMEKLTQEIVDIFIKKIYVYRDKKVEIEWNFRMN